MDKTILVSVFALISTFVTAVTAILIAVWNMFASKKNAEGLEKLKADFAETAKEKDARRDYEYEARKRLYQECEPLLFQMREASEDALHRIFSIARTSKKGKLSTTDENWLASNEYYLLSTIHALIVPLAIYRLLRRELTLVDFNMDLSIRYRYELSKKIYLSFTEDFSLANSFDKLTYDPFVSNWKVEREKNPQQLWRQGVVIGKLEKAIEAIIIKNESNGKSRWMNYGEFETAFENDCNGFSNCVSVFVDLFKGFNPKKLPVLWRILSYQAYLYHVMIGATKDDPYILRQHVPLEEMPEFELEKLDWLNPKENVNDDWKEHISSVNAFLKNNLESVCQISSSNISNSI